MQMVRKQQSILHQFLLSQNVKWNLAHSRQCTLCCYEFHRCIKMISVQDLMGWINENLSQYSLAIAEGRPKIARAPRQGSSRDQTKLDYWERCPRLTLRFRKQLAKSSHGTMEEGTDRLAVLCKETVAQRAWNCGHWQRSAMLNGHCVSNMDVL